MAGFRSQSGAEKWARKQSREVVVVFAARAAARTLPFVGQSKAAAIGDLAFHSLRAILTASGRAVYTTDAVRQAVSAAFASAASADSAAFAAASSAAADSSSSFASSRYDAALLELQTPGAVFELPLWRDGAIPEWMGRDLAALKAFWNAQPEVWGFWADWYQGLLDGRAPDWDLWHDIAIIPDPDWKQGPAHVAGIIERLRLKSRTAIAAPLIWDQDLGVLTIAKENPLPDRTLSFARDRINLALGNALAASSTNGFTEESDEAIAIRTVMERHGTDGSLLATGFWDAALSLNNHIGDRYPDDPSLINLKNALWVVVDEICEIDEEARKRCHRLSVLAQPKPLKVSEKPQVEEMAEVVAHYADEGATETIRWYAKTITGTRNASKWVRARFTNLMSTAAILLDRMKKGGDRIEWLIRKIDDLLRWWNGPGA